MSADEDAFQFHFLFQPSLPQDKYSRYICNAEQLIQTERD